MKKESNLKSRLYLIQSKKIEELSENQRKNILTLKTLNNQTEQEVLKSPIDGTIHLTEEFKGQTELPKGTVIAEIYPKQSKKQLSFTVAFPPTSTWAAI